MQCKRYRVTRSLSNLPHAKDDGKMRHCPSQIFNLLLAAYVTGASSHPQI